MNIVLTKEEGIDVGEYLIKGSYDHNDMYSLTFIDGVYKINKIQPTEVLKNRE